MSESNKSKGKVAAALRSTAVQICPPIVLPILKGIYRSVIRQKNRLVQHAAHQELDVYWDPEMAAILETWGEGNVWDEIQLLCVNCRGKVLDIACGTGKTMEILSKFPQLELHGCDISDLLINKAIKRGIAPDRVMVADATSMPYADDHFDYAYSIGSLEHFTGDGILRFLSECRRITAKASFHQHPVSRSGEDEGWISHNQSYFNNSVDWWLKNYLSVYSEVYVLDSSWQDPRSIGKWFVCVK